MNRMRMRALLTIIVLIFLAVFCSGSALAMKDGTEEQTLQVAEPSQLIIHLSRDQAGAVFCLKTDVGMYPGNITADETGTLRVEIGGSSFYELTLLNTKQTQATVFDEASLSEEPTARPNPQESPYSTEESAGESLKIPFLHIAVFVACLAILAILAFLHFRKRNQYDNEE